MANATGTIAHATGTTYVHFLRRNNEEELWFITTDEKYDEQRDAEFILRMFIQKYGGNWNAYEELLIDVNRGVTTIHTYTARELTSAPIKHDDLRWIHAIPPLTVVEEKNNVAVGRS